jgi:tetratricopeptide (TPR) repeat protein
LTERERYLVTAAYHSVVTGNRDLQIQAYRTVLDQYPDDTYALNNLGVIYGELRDFDRSADLYGQALDVDPTTRLYYSNLSSTLGKLKMWDTAAFVSDLFAERFPANPEVKLSGVLLAALKEDYDSAQILVEGLLADQRGTVFWEAIAYEWWGHLDALQGRLGDARRRWQRAFDLTTGRDVGGAYLQRTARRAVVERLLLADADRALGLIDEALERYPMDELVQLDRPYGEVAFALAACGAPARATVLLDEYYATPEADHSETAERWAVGARGVVALVEERYDDAIASLREFDEGNACATCAYPWLAQAYDRTGQADSALALYERFVDLPSYDLWYDGGHLGPAFNRMGELYEARGENQHAIDHYTNLVELWDKADPEFQPWVDEARRAVERLTAEPREVRR